MLILHSTFIGTHSTSHWSRTFTSFSHSTRRWHSVPFWKLPECQSHDCKVFEALPARSYNKNYIFDFLLLMEMCNVKLNWIFIFFRKAAEILSHRNIKIVMSPHLDMDRLKDLVWTELSCPWTWPRNSWKEYESNYNNNWSRYLVC